MWEACIAMRGFQSKCQQTHQILQTRRKNQVEVRDAQNVSERRLRITQLKLVGQCVHYARERSCPLLNESIDRELSMALFIYTK